MKKLKLTISITIITTSFICFFYNTLWFWFNNPELTEMQVLILKWPWMALAIVAGILTMWVLPEGTVVDLPIGKNPESLGKNARIPPPPQANVTVLTVPTFSELCSALADYCRRVKTRDRSEEEK